MTDGSSFIRIMGQRVLLRDPLPADALWDFRWGTVETAWQDWDAPWEGAAITPIEQLSAEDIVQRLQRGFARFAEPGPIPRNYLRVDRIGGPPLGWVNSYHHDPEARVTWAGVSICESAYWGQGLGTEAFRLWIGCLFTHLDLAEVRTATWSGNARMIRVAEKCGFTLINRIPRNREVRGEWYDGLTFQLTRERWERTRGRP